jgi:protein disulfide-isomerase A1
LAVAFFGETSSREYTEVFLNVARNPTVAEKFQFYHLNDKECASQNGASATPGLVLFRRFDTPRVPFTGNWETTPVIDFMVAQSVPTLIDFSEDYIEPIFGQRKAAVFLFRSKSDEGSDYVKVFTEASQQLRGQILFVVSGVTEGIQQRLGEFIGVEEKDLPTLRLLDPADGMKKFNYQGSVQSLTVDNIRQFVDDFQNKRLQAFLKSEEIPAESNDPLKIIVGKNF